LSKRNNQKVQIIPLGGLGEIGKNMYVIRYNNSLLVIDAGLKFPEDEMLGVDVVIPDVSYLVEHKQEIKAILLTHGHEDHIGALPYILPHLEGIPLYGTRLTLGLVEVKLREHGLLHNTKMNTIKPGGSLHLPPFEVEFFRTNHSIPDSVGVSVNTPAGRIVHTGDFKFDQTPVNGLIMDYNRLTSYGNDGVLVALSDSTNAERPGVTFSEKEVGESISEIFRTAPARIIVATFASNVHRIQQVIDAAERYGRKVSVVGRSMVSVVNIALELGYLRIKPDTLVEIEEINRLPAEKIVLISTGSQGEPMSALTRMSMAEHRKVEIVPDDTVVIAASAIPGNERLINRTIDNLFKRGANVIYEQVSGVHVSGHASQEELKMMLNFLRPRYFVPIHGDYRHLIHHAKLAENVGIPKQNIFVVENGNVLEFSAHGGRVVRDVNASMVFVDGLGIGDVGNIVIRDRQILSQDGIVIVVLTISKQDGQVIAGPDIVSRGFVYVRESEELLEEAKNIIANNLSGLSRQQRGEWTAIKNTVKETTSHYLWEKTGRRPMILPIIMEV